MIKWILSTVPELLTRLVIGLLFVESGWGKFKNMSQVVAYFESLKIPFAHIQAPLVSTVELVAGTLIVLGLGTRLASLPLMAIMLVALMTAKADEITSLSSLFEISEFLYFVLLSWLAAFGAKHLSADSFICKSVGPK